MQQIGSDKLFQLFAEEGLSHCTLAVESIVTPPHVTTHYSNVFSVGLFGLDHLENLGNSS